MGYGHYGVQTLQILSNIPFVSNSQIYFWKSILYCHWVMYVYHYVTLLLCCSQYTSTIRGGTDTTDFSRQMSAISLSLNSSSSVWSGKSFLF